MSACSVLFVLDRFLREMSGTGHYVKRDKYGLIGALGPGFIAELVLVGF
jgi:predicted naringenin-chalcone synthase